MLKVSMTLLIKFVNFFFCILYIKILTFEQYYQQNILLGVINEQTLEDYLVKINTIFQIKSTNEVPSNEEIMKHAKFFETEVTLNHLNRDQLMALCKLLQVVILNNITYSI